MSHQTFLIDSLSPVITEKVNMFLGFLSPEEKTHQDTVDSIRKQIEETNIPQVKVALAGVVKTMESERPDGSTERRKQAALAIIHIANSLKLPITLKDPAKSEKVSKVKAEGESKKRLTKVEMAKLSGDVLKVLVEKKTAKIADIAAAVGAEVMVVRSALLKLHRDGKAESTGVKGKNGAWKVK